MTLASQTDETTQSVLTSEEVIDFTSLQRVGEELGVNPNQILAKSHGRRTIDVLKDYEPRLANWDYVRQVESHIPHEFGYDASEIPGSRALLTSVASAGNDCRKDDTSHSKISSNIPWAIVTSGTAPLVNAWLDVMKIEAHPPHLISAETVAHGKPNPEGYLLALRKLGLHKSSSSTSPSRDKVDNVERTKSKDSIGEEEKGDKCGKDYKSYDTKDILVLEDSPAGVRAGKAAGCRVVALLTTHERSALEEAGADWIVKDMRSVVFRGWKDAIANNNGEVEKGGIVSIAIVNNLRSRHG